MPGLINRRADGEPYHLQEITMPNKQIIDVNLEGLPRPLAAAVRYLAAESWKTEQTPTPNVHTAPDAARMLGIPYSTLTLWIRQGKIEAWKQGHHWRVDVEDAREYMLRNSV